MVSEVILNSFKHSSGFSNNKQLYFFKLNLGDLKLTSEHLEASAGNAVLFLELYKIPVRKIIN